METACGDEASTALPAQHWMKGAGERVHCKKILNNNDNNNNTENMKVRMKKKSENIFFFCLLL